MARRSRRDQAPKSSDSTSKSLGSGDEVCAACLHLAEAEPTAGALLAGSGGSWRGLGQFRQVGQSRPGDRRARRADQVVVAKLAALERMPDGGRVEPALQLEAIGVEDIPARQWALRKSGPIPAALGRPG